MANTSPYSFGMDYVEVMKKIEKKIFRVFNDLCKNVFKANADRFHFFVSPFSNGTFNISRYNIESSHSEELSRIIIASYLTFEEHGK